MMKITNSYLIQYQLFKYLFYSIKIDFLTLAGNLNTLFRGSSNF